MRTEAAATTYGQILEFLRRLDRLAVYYNLASARSEAVMVQIALPGQRWEVEFLEDGSVEVERFYSDGAIADESAFDELWDLLARDAG